MKKALGLGSVAATAAMVPAIAEAHTGAAGAAHFAGGFLHPLGGADHALAMIAVGLFAAHLGGRALWMLPAAFVAVMAGGAALGLSGLALPLVETMVAASVVVLGLAVWRRWTLPPVAAAGLVAVFALFHGQAHAAEIPAAGSALAYAAGFLAATAGLHLAGLGAGLAAARLGRLAPALLRAAGALAAVAGLGILSGLA